ncbi:hypothetical protein [Methylobacterium gossipiicola]|uniref:Uncharacterized protein n=1 Tax=Methylobacterium gossipiicola TaxID=582675 RepID=A0A1I2VZL2_9HYPH|nr:hypothetical protein [Methylobacterium gossipiicola]SFG92731.1 hypothetical protein SAMN05192565_11785 [Methylobacterium gossipiicola]
MSAIDVSAAPVEPPDFVRRPALAGALIDAGEEILARRRVPCLCPEQVRGACGRTTGYATTGGRIRERVACERCPRTWTRINC